MKTLNTYCLQSLELYTRVLKSSVLVCTPSLEYTSLFIVHKVHSLEIYFVKFIHEVFISKVSTQWYENFSLYSIKNFNGVEYF